MAVNPRMKSRACRLEPFAPVHAPCVAGWVRGLQEAYWLAPKNAPPVTPDTVLSWQAATGHEALLLYDASRETPVGYGELNVLRSGRGRYWLGHLIVEPERRGCGYGVELVRLLLERAFEAKEATQVTLVVFPGNRPAIRCYKSAGMREDGWETHEFPAWGRVEHLLRFAATRGTRKSI